MGQLVEFSKLPAGKGRPLSGAEGGRVGTNRLRKKKKKILKKKKKKNCTGQNLKIKKMQVKNNKKGLKMSAKIPINRNRKLSLKKKKKMRWNSDDDEKLLGGCGRGLRWVEDTSVEGVAFSGIFIKQISKYWLVDCPLKTESHSPCGTDFPREKWQVDL